jgi:hypothetical protein
MAAWVPASRDLELDGMMWYNSDGNKVNRPGYSGASVM